MPALHAQEQEAEAGLVILDETGMRNLGIRTVEATETVFEQTVFALGRIEAQPQSIGVVSSRISGRVIALSAFPGQSVEKGEPVMRIESRQAGGSPVVIELTAPLGGTVTALDVRLGDPVEPDRALLTVSNLSEVYAVARVPEIAAAALQTGAQARILVPALGSEPLQGRLLRFSPLADAASGTVDAVFLLANPHGRLLPGMRAEFAIVISAREGVVSVPRRAVQGSAANRFVYVKHFELAGGFIKTPVVLGELNDRYAEITHGLFPADEVVTDGAYSLSFVGGGTVSLKEALDAAHGHAHNEDGSEIGGKGGASGSRSGSGSGNDGDGHDHGAEDGHGGHGLLGSALLWQVVSGVLFVALLFTLGGRRRANDEHGADNTAAPAAKATTNPTGKEGA